MADVIGLMRQETLRLVELLKTGNKGDILTDERLTEVCGKNVKPYGDGQRGAGYGYLISAIRYVLKHHALHWKRIVGAGAIKCCQADDTIGDVHADSKRVSRASKRSLRKLATVELAGLDETQKADCLALVAQHGTLALVAKNATQKKLVARKATEAVDLDRLLENIKGAV